MSPRLQTSTKKSRKEARMTTHYETRWNSKGQAVSVKIVCCGDKASGGK